MLASGNKKANPEKDDYLMLKRIQTTGKAAVPAGDTETEGMLDDLLTTKPAKKKRVLKPKEPLVNYDIFMPDIKGPDAKKLFSDPKALAGYLQSDDKVFMEATDSFQRQYLHEEPRIWWQFEKVHNFGDYVLLFPNPDFKDLEPDMNNGISFPDALSWFETIVGSTQLEFSGKKKFMVALQEAFEEAFLELEEFIPLKESEKKALENQRTEVAKTQTQMNLDRSAEEPSFSAATKGNKGTSEIDHEKSELKGDCVCVSLHKIHKQQQNGDAKMTPAKALLIHGLKDKMKEKFGQLKESSTGVSNSPKKQKENKKSDSKKVDFSSPGGDEAYEVQKTKLRKIWGGGMYSKPEMSSEDADSVKENKYYWSIAQTQSRKTCDFLTLMRKTVAAVLAQQGFVMREIFVNDGKQIALVITFPEQNLHKYAIKLNMVKTAEFGVVDLLSLEPIDAKGRPLRFNRLLFDEGSWERRYVRDFFSNLDDTNPLKSDKSKVTAETERISKLRGQILELLDNDCNFKKISKLCQFIQWDLMEEEPMVSGDILSHEHVPIQVWEDFYGYLVALSMRIHEIRHFRDKINLIIDVHYSDGKVAVHGREKRRRFDNVELKKMVTHEVTKAMRDCIHIFPNLKNIWTSVNLKN